MSWAHLRQGPRNIHASSRKSEQKGQVEVGGRRDRKKRQGQYRVPDVGHTGVALLYADQDRRCGGAWQGMGPVVELIQH